MMGFMLNNCNVNSDSKVLLVENTKGLMTGAIVERQPNYVLRVEFSSDSMRCNNEILDQFDYPTEDMITVGYIHGKLLVPCEKGKPDPMQQAMAIQYKSKFNSYIFAHDELHPLEVW